jgi:GNAT superfamily N-acetyltransferase
MARDCYYRRPPASTVEGLKLACQGLGGKINRCRCGLNDLAESEREDLVAFLEEERLPERASDARTGDTFGIMLVATECGGALGMIEGPLTERWWNGGEPQGHISPFAYAYQVIVKPDDRRRGVGRSLMVAFARAAMAAGCTWIQLLEHPRADDGQRQAFFSALGFERLYVPDAPRLWGAPADLVIQTSAPEV